MNPTISVKYLLFIMSICCASNCYAYRSEAHKAINSNAIRQKLSSDPLMRFFQENLGYTNLEKVNGYQISEWFTKAGAQEDEPGFRTKNHFLDPIANSGFSGILFGRVGTGEPTVVWAQKGLGQQSPGGAHSWQDGRQYFYTALTSNSTAVREEKLTDSFRALGQVMHLVSDMSVPEHTRDTSHIFSKTIEPWLEKVLTPNTPLNTKYSTQMVNALNNPISPAPSLLQQPGIFPGTPIPIANLYDAEQFTGTNPNITITGPIGLAEYTNANFFSFNTIFKNYGHPAESSVQAYEEIDEESGKLMKFICRVSDGEQVQHLAQATVFHKFIVLKKNGYTLENDKIYADYMEKLIPRAVGYAGALLEYFYRGTLEISPPEQNVYGIIDGSVIPQQFITIAAKVKNTTPNEAITAGSLVAVARYKVDANYLPDLSNNPTDNTAASFAYSVSAPATITPAEFATINTSPTEFTFDFSASPIPAGITDLSLQVVFKGTLGNEADSAVAVGMRNVSEPTHHVFWNNADMFSLDYQLHTAAAIKADPLLAERVDDNHNGIFNEPEEPYIDPHAMDFEIAYSPASSTAFTADVLATATLPAGRHIRLIGIFDKDAPNYLQFNYSRSGEATASYFGSGITGAVAENGANSPAIFGFRYWDNAGTHVPIRQYFKVGIVNCKPVSVNADGSSYCTYPEEQAIAATKAPYPVDPL